MLDEHIAEPGDFDFGLVGVRSRTAIYDERFGFVDRDTKSILGERGKEI